VEMDMKIVSSFVFVICLTGPAFAQLATAPGPEMSAGVIGMNLAAGVVYLIKRRHRR
jgi:hypothetical protein